VAEHLDGLRLAEVPAEMDHEPLFPWKSRHSPRKLSPAGAVHEGEGGSGTGVAAPTAGQGPSVTAEDADGFTTAGNHPSSVAPTNTGWRQGPRRTRNTDSLEWVSSKNEDVPIIGYLLGVGGHYSLFRWQNFPSLTRADEDRS
jgi:hypothetical protein